MRLKLSSTIAILLVSVTSVYGSDFIPDNIQRIGIGTSFAEVAKSFPAAKLILDDQARGTRLTLIDIQSSNFWESAVFEFNNDRLASISLVAGMTKKRNEEQARDLLIREAISNYGTQFIKRIGLIEEMHPQPILVWKLKNIAYYLSVDTPVNQGLGGKYHIRFVIASSERDIRDLFEIPTCEKLETLVFEWLAGEITRSK